MVKPNTNTSSLSSSIDPNSGFCSESKIYHNLRPQASLPPETTPLSLTQYVFSLLHQNQTLTTTPYSAAFIDATSRHHRSISFSELETRTKTLATSLQNIIGLSKGDCAFVLSPNSVNVCLLYLSLLSLGVIVSPSNPASTPPEISRQIHLSKPVIAFATSDTTHKLPSLLRHRTILIDSPDFDSLNSQRLESHFYPVQVFPGDVAAIMYSSGTTGKIKGVMLTHRNFIAALAGVHAMRPEKSSSAAAAVVLCTFPYFHMAGFTLCIRTVSLGETLVSMETFDLRVMLRVIQDFRVTIAAVAPPVIVALVNSGCVVVQDYDLSSLEVVLSGGAPLTNALLAKFKSKFPNLLLGQGYGMTETAGGVARTVGPNECQVLGSTGRLLSNCQARIVDPDTGICLPPFKQGELWVRGPYIMKGYVEDNESTAAIMDSEGWLRTGDLCYFDSEGFLFYVDRIKELIKYKGYQVPPVELEHILQSHPDIIDAAVIPYPDEVAGQLPMAFVVKRTGSTITESQIMDFVAEQVAPYKKIRRLLFVNSIPKNAPGKVLRKELIKLALSGGTSKL